MRILLVEDNRPLSEWLTRVLQRERYAVECAYDGDDANLRLRSQCYDLVILDLALPRMDGEEVLRRLRRRDDNVPVLILTARDTLEGRVGGLDSGADDYMAKPFDVAELEARIRVLLRRRANHRNPVLRMGNLAFDSNTREFSVGQAPLSLTPREHAVLQALLMKPGCTVSKHALADSLYTLEDNVSPDAIEIYVHRLRKKMEGCDASIITLRGLGYLLKSHGVQ
ncbi:MAG: transcriptional regulatory, terminal family protein [Ramlibacter sp.]|nr:transcriptional regulatory, terminal family protein [Ramlibacter sp.]